mgnify:CR=1 FL=1
MSLVCLVWLKFFLCLAVILFAGTKLARYGDVIAEKTGLGRVWIGLIFLAAITSMPELVTSVSSVVLVDSPDLALGTLLGSCLFNLSILALLDILHARTPVLTGASSRHVAPAGLGIALAAVAAGGIMYGGRISWLTLGRIGVPSIIILIIYLLGMRRVLQLERSSQVPAETDCSQYSGVSGKTIYIKFALAAAAVVGAGIWLSYVGDEIGEVTGWNASFVGSLFLAITTSAPELAVAIAALRLNAIDMAVADILGANMLDLAVIALVDVSYNKPILSSVSTTHFITAVIVVAMNLLVIAGLRLRQKRKTFVFISWYALALIGLYIFGGYAIFTSSIGLR